jgi:diguanylate cyclase (GGDEF)-like protein/PAS domain S-box-containing protein
VKTADKTSPENLESGEQTKAPLRDASGTVAVLDVDGNLCRVSNAASEFLGYPSHRMLGTSVFRLVHPEDLPAARRLLATVAKKPGSSGHTELCIGPAEGEWRWVEATFQNLFDLLSVGGILMDVRNIAERKRAEEELKRGESRFSAAQRLARLGTWNYELGEDRAYCSDELYRIFGHAPQGFAPRYKKLLRLVHPNDRELVQEWFREALHDRGQPGIVYRIVQPSGEIRFVRTRCEATRDETGRLVGLVGTVQDATEDKVLEEQLAHRMLHDPLTSLPNRALFMDRLGHALARAERPQESEDPIAVLVLNLNNFKVINDSLGHEVGDRLLAAVAERLRLCLRPSDTVARLSGDEFAVLLEGAGLSDVVQVAERIANELRAPFPLGVAGHEAYITARIGIARTPLVVLRGEVG